MNAPSLLTLYRNARICPSGDPGDILEPGAIAIQADRVIWIGNDGEIPRELSAAAPRTYDLARRWITPGLVDCHTHLIYGGCRADEFRMRLSGKSYEQITRAGGGINSTVRATRLASEESLFSQAARRLRALIAEGVTAVEVKSGYGLNLDDERKMLKVARRLGESFSVTVYTTFLGAHALPPEFSGRPDDYISSICNEIMPALHGEGLVDAVDVFCENIAFSISQAERVFKRALELGLPVKIHAEQLTNMGAARLAARYHALSADHLEHLDEAGVLAMKSGGVVAVLLPCASYFLRETRQPPVELMRQHNIPLAIATDSNPGTSPTTSILLAMNMACTLFRMTPAEALAGVTRHAARALGKSDSHGLLAAGRYADFCVWDIDSLSELAYWIGFNPLHVVVQHGATTSGARVPDWR
ncbi:MAG TPA: imidazolonepropionase [Bryobacteraceae bacterium]|nr:imidazolonepropionase [Bryobacteraceae bacterium]